MSQVKTAPPPPRSPFQVLFFKELKKLTDASSKGEGYKHNLPPWKPKAVSSYIYMTSETFSPTGDSQMSISRYFPNFELMFV